MVPIFDLWPPYCSSPTCDEILYSNRHFLLHYAASSSRALCSNQLESLRSQPYFSTRTPRNRIAFLGLVSMSFIMDIVHSDPAKNSKFSGPFAFLSLPGEICNQIYTLYFAQDIYDWNLGLAKYNDDFEYKFPIYFEILLVSRRIYPPAATTTTAIQDSHLRKRNAQTYSRVGVVALRRSRTKLPQHVRLYEITALEYPSLHV